MKQNRSSDEFLFKLILPFFWLLIVASFAVFKPIFGMAASKPGVAEKGLMYQIYIRAFEEGDTAHDGHGDFLGVLNRLDYLESLGVSTLLLMPVFESTGGMGYIPVDFFKPDAHYGSEADFKKLTAAAHARGMRVLLDAPINHISDSSLWFREARKASCSGNQSPTEFCDYFYFSDDPCNALPYKNWHKPWNWERTSCLDVWFAPYGFDPAKDRPEKYYATFFAGMPDLKFWKFEAQTWNEPVVAQIKGVLRKWLMLGADGFRIDAAKHLVEGSNTNAAAADARNLEFLQILLVDARQVAPHAEFLGEIWSGHDVIDKYLPTPLTRSLDFPFMDSLRESLSEENPEKFRRVLEHFASTQQTIPATARVVFFGNHDVSRLESLWPGNLARQKLAFLLTLTMPQTPLILYGEELGMEGKVKRPDPRDPSDKLEYVRTDRAMPWNAQGTFGPDGASSPVVALPENIATKNLEAASGDPDALLAFLRKLAELRRTGLIGSGSTFVSTTSQDQVIRVEMAFDDSRRVVVFANFSAASAQRLPEGFRINGAGRVPVLQSGYREDSGGTVLDALGYAIFISGQ